MFYLLRKVYVSNFGSHVLPSKKILCLQLWWVHPVHRKHNQTYPEPLWCPFLIEYLRPGFCSLYMCWKVISWKELTRDLMHRIEFDRISGSKSMKSFTPSMVAFASPNICRCSRSIHFANKRTPRSGMISDLLLVLVPPSH